MVAQCAARRKGFVLFTRRKGKNSLLGMRKTGLRIVRTATAICVFAAACCFAGAQMGDTPGMQHHHHDAPEKLGSVSFPVVCAEATEAPMERGIAVAAAK